MMKTKRKLDYIPEAIRYLCLAVVFVLGFFSIMATGGGGGDDSSGSSSGTYLLSEARVTVTSTATAAGVQGARVEGRFLDKDTNVTETTSCVTGASGKCTVTVEITGQLAEEVTLTVSHPDFYTATHTATLPSTGSTSATVYMTPK
jgi:hypothetical protein